MQPPLPLRPLLIQNFGRSVTEGRQRVLLGRKKWGKGEEEGGPFHLLFLSFTATEKRRRRRSGGRGGNLIDLVGVEEEETVVTSRSSSFRVCANMQERWELEVICKRALSPTSRNLLLFLVVAVFGPGDTSAPSANKRGNEGPQ